MRFEVLGPLEVRTVTGRPVRVPEVKVRALLACLIADHGRVVPTARLIDALWAGAPPANPTASLQAKVSQLRRVLEDAEEGARDLVVHRAPGYMLRATPDTVDVGEFRTLVAHSRKLEDPRARATALAKALALWRGPAFADFADGPLVRTAVAGLEEERLTAVEEHMEARLDCGEHSLLVGELTALVAAHPLRERLRMAHMRALYHVGRSSEALDSYTDLRRHLAEELGLTPGQVLEALQQAILRQDPALNGVLPEPYAAPSMRARTNLPDVADDLVGREDAVAESRRLLSRHRLVTFTGPGGVGKTRLAVAVAAGLVGEFPDGVWLVELAGLRFVDGAEGLSCVSQHVLAALDIRESTEGTTVPEADIDHGCRSERRLVEFAASRRMLLVLDNCEHMVDDVAMLVGRLLERAPGVKLLTTSQEPLRVQGETVWPVPPLRLPESTEPEALEQSSAVRLFVERARSADPTFVVDAETAPAIAALCRRLDGTPLALELAATRVRALGIHQLLERLDDRFRVLKSGYRGAPHRQQTLQATIDWSWSLLTPQEQTVLRRLSVHVDGCALDAAEQVCAGGEVAADEVVDILARLVDRSLVVRSDAPHGARYQLLESVAVYAQARLTDSGEAAEVARRHADHYVRLAEEARPHLGGPEQHRWLRRLSAETGNVRRTLQELRGARSAEPTLRLVNALAWFWILMGRLTEGHRSLCSALELAAVLPGPEEGGPDRPATPAVAEAAAWCQGIRLLLGEVKLEEHCRVAGQDAPGVRTVGLARAKWFTGYALWDVGALAAAEQLVNEALADFRALRDEWGVAAALSSRAALAMTRGDLDSLHDDALEARAQFTRLGDAWGELKAAQALAVNAEITAAYGQATQLHREGLRMAESLELWPEVSRQLSGLGRIALLSESYDEADEFHRRAMRLAVEQGNRPAEQMAELGLALGARRRGDLEVAERHLRPWLAWNRSRGANNALALIWAELGFCAELRDDAAESLARHRDGLVAAVASEDPRAVALALEGLAGAHALQGDAVRAARLLGTAEATRERSGAPLPRAEQGDVRRVSARARDLLGAEVFAAQVAAGREVDHLVAADAELGGTSAGLPGSEGLPASAGRAEGTGAGSDSRSDSASGSGEPEAGRRPDCSPETSAEGQPGGSGPDAAEEPADACSLQARARHPPQWIRPCPTDRNFRAEDAGWPGRDIPA
ncbi:BTAD domain-containing putative transcriptional regulator [Streptomyces tirandamycinicus]|uniref:BTAD domain-containing putative transcriptional regulator n=1 Tax=Streptomyces tirandamycinicus TaxID=2174846 RepID=UPI0022700E7F|nr:BTAD domain-containing putative transcriptional regulator [Streptomyces tirandamycinicus]MCY0983601.1 BTAD domain-containing putative transcriptional regulator [Streptomyces tirandamycinicus]